MASRLLLLLMTLLSPGVAAVVHGGTTHTAASSTDQDHTANDIAFDLADLTVTVATPLPLGGEFHLEAYKSVHNDRILQSSLRGATSELSWVSVGQPTFVRTPDAASIVYGNASTSPKRLFHFTPTGFYAHVQMLTPAHRALLAARATHKYAVNVTDEQIVSLVLSTFTCELYVYDSSNTRHLLNGEVTDFLHFPLRVDFKAPLGGNERTLFENHLTTAGEDTAFTCRMTSKAHLQRTAVLTIGLPQLERIGLVEKLFGSARATSVDSGAVVGGPEMAYVTRFQMKQLAAELYSTLNIANDFKLSEVEFSDAFVDDFIRQVAVSDFSPTAIDTALPGLSNYGFGPDSGDLRPNRLRSRLDRTLTVSRRLIVLNENSYAEMERPSTSSSPGAVGSTVARLYGLEGSARWARANARRAGSPPATPDQLAELNRATVNEIVWSLDDDDVLAARLVVARLDRARLVAGGGLSFRRIQSQTTVAAFDRTFGLYTLRATSGPAVGVDTVATTAVERRLIDATEALRAELGAEMRQLRSDLERRVIAACEKRQTTAATPEPAPRPPPTPSSPVRRLASIELNRTLADGRCIYGLAATNTRLYVSRAHEKTLEVYDAASLAPLGRLPVLDLGCVNDMASCPGCELVYVADRCNRVIHAVDSQHGVRFQWPVPDRPSGVGVASPIANVVVTFDAARLLRVYAPDTGRLVREIALPSEVANPRHAVEVADGFFAVAHGRLDADGEPAHHRVCVVDTAGRVVLSFGGVRGAEIGSLDTPTHLTTVDGSLIVADLNNDRLVLLEAATLRFVRALVSTRAEDVDPARVAIGRDGARLFVSYQKFANGVCRSGAVRVFNLVWI